MEKQILTNSSTTTFRTCPRKYEIKYEKGYVPIHDREHLFFGKLMHKGIEILSETGNLADALQAIEKKCIGYDDPYLVVKASALMEGYFNRYKDDDEKIIGIEKEFKAPVLNPETTQESRNFVFMGVIDRIIQKPNGRNFIRETKTTTENIEDPASDYWLNLQIDSQVSGYYLGAEALGYPIEGCSYDVIKKPTIRPSQVGKQVDPENPKRIETPAEYLERLRTDICSRPNFYYARREVPRLQSDLYDFSFDLWYTAQNLRALQLKGKFPRHTRSCIGIYGTCPYFAVCTGRGSLEDQSSFKKLKAVHEELKKQVA